LFAFFIWGGQFCRTSIRHLCGVAGYNFMLLSSMSLLHAHLNNNAGIERLTSAFGMLLLFMG
jgi:hypothetical protein